MPRQFVDPLRPFEQGDDAVVVGGFVQIILRFAHQALPRLVPDVVAHFVEPLVSDQRGVFGEYLFLPFAAFVFRQEIDHLLAVFDFLGQLQVSGEQGVGWEADFELPGEFVTIAGSAYLPAGVDRGGVAGHQHIGQDFVGGVFLHAAAVEPEEIGMDSGAFEDLFTIEVVTGGEFAKVDACLHGLAVQEESLFLRLPAHDLQFDKAGFLDLGVGKDGGRVSQELQAFVLDQDSDLERVEALRLAGGENF